MADMDDTMPDTDALTNPKDQSLDPMTPGGTGPTGTGTAADGAMGTAQAGPGAGQHGDDIDPSGADTTGADMTGVGASSPGKEIAPGVAGDPDGEAPGASKTPESL